MNPWNLSAGDLLAFGIAIHLFADFPLQNDWMANHKMRRRIRRGSDRVVVPSPWWDRHLAAYVHAGIHGILLSLVFGWAAIPLAVVHLIIDCRWIVEKWSRLIKQTPPTIMVINNPKVALLDIGTEVRIWTDQTFHITCVAVAALLVTL